MSSRQLRLDDVSGAGSASQPDRRRIERHTARGEIGIASSSGERASAHVNDVSAYGCNLESGAAWLRSGRFITLHAGERAIQAVVRWAREGTAGVEFLRPIAAADETALAG
ncbi:MAG: PilZ domain-containing protein [Novosphingobium sp.]